MPFCRQSRRLSHGTPVLGLRSRHGLALNMRFVDWLASFTSGKEHACQLPAQRWRYDYFATLGAKRRAWADMILDYLFALQNDPTTPVSIIILSGDIHTSGYANIYSSDPAHVKRSSIPHITSSSVAYVPFNWLMEAI
jgi:hypothetical protein